MRNLDPQASLDDGESGFRWHEHDVDAALERIRSSRAGLSAEECARRARRYGENALRPAKRPSLLATFAAQFADVTILLLAAAAGISVFVGEIADAAVIVTIIVLNAVLGLIQQNRAERAMRALRRMAAPNAIARRDGTPRSIPSSALVPGDVVLLEAGAIVPADLRLIEVAALRVDESALTGESAPVDKTVEVVSGPDLTVGDRRNLAYKGTVVTYGRAEGVVIATGMRTQLGRIARVLHEAHGQSTPLQRRLEGFGRRLALVVVVICAVVFATGMLRGEPALPMFLTALSLAVAAVPEALPAVVSISLALGARKMAQRRALVRRLPAVETLGSVTTICSDKTGTLTMNRMRVEEYFCDGRRSPHPGAGEPWDRLLLAMSISHDALDGPDGDVVGDPTEAALLRAATAAGRRRADDLERFPRIAELPFDANRKRMTTFHRRADGSAFAITKGAPEAIVAHCVATLGAPRDAPFDPDRLTGVAEDMASRGLRVLAVAVREWPESPPAAPTAPLAERDLQFVGFLGLLDPPRPQVTAAIATCVGAGIVPVMITGDHPATARAVATRLGLAPPKTRVLTGAQLAAMSDERLREVVRSVRVYARVEPTQKLKIVTALQAHGEVVAMTGDGVNDAPALQKADIGVAMGVAGTDVARQASAMVLLDDDFATIVAAVREGRRIYDNIRRFVRYILTTNSSEVWTIFLAPLLGLPVPLQPIQILWINLVTDGLPSLALTAEPAEGDLMRRPPRPPQESLFARGLGLHALLIGLAMAGLVLATQAWLLHVGSRAWQTAVFSTLCFVQLAHVLVIRSEHTSILRLNPLGNLPLLAAVAATFLLQLGMIYLPAANTVFGTTPLSPTELALCLLCAAVVLILVEAEKAVRRRAGRTGDATEWSSSGEPEP